MKRVFVNGAPMRGVRVVDNHVVIGPKADIELGVMCHVMVVDRPWWSFALDSARYWLWYRWRP